MTDLFKSAFGYISSQTETIRNTVAGSSTLSTVGNNLGKTNHELVGTSVEVGSLRLYIRSLLAEGGFALVFSVQDNQSNWYALKRQIATNKETTNCILKEIRFLRQLTTHPNILNYANAAQLKNANGSTEFLLLTELCSGGSVIDLMRKHKKLSHEQIIKIFHGACSAISYMHSQSPPLIHRDMKVENLLFDKSGFLKLCDFGSATNTEYHPNDTWSSLERGNLEEEMTKNTTPMYRAPEIMEIYSNYPIGVGMDIWALGCVLYYLCFQRHPFEDSSKLRIVHANYTLPGESSYTVFYPLISGCLKPNPSDRPTSTHLVESSLVLADSLGVDLSKPISGVENIIERVDPIPVGPKQAGINNESSSQGSVLNSLKGQGLSLFKNLKEKSRDVVQTVQSTYGGKGPDFCWISSRILISPISDNIPDALFSTAEESLKFHLYQVTQGKPFMLYNLGSRNLKSDYSGSSKETPLPNGASGIAPSLNYIFELLTKISLHLSNNSKNIVVFTGPEITCIFMTTALLIFNKLCPTADVSSIVGSILRSRNNEDNKKLPLCFIRQLDYIQTIVNCESQQLRSLVHNRPITVETLTLSYVPVANRAKTGCKPYVEIYSGGNKLWSTFKDYTLLKEYNSLHDSSITMELDGLPISNDVTIILHHARFNRMTNRITSVFMFSFGFHASFLDDSQSSLEFDLKNIDVNTNGEVLLHPDFKAILQIKISGSDRGFNASNTPNFLKYQDSHSSQLNVVKNMEERDFLASSFTSNNNLLSRKIHYEENIVPDSEEKTDANFFDSLSWDNHQAQKTAPPRPPLPTATNQEVNLFDDAEVHERLAGIRVQKETESEDADEYKFDYEKTTSKPKEEPKLVSESFDLLGLGDEIPSSYSATTNETNNDPFNVFSSIPMTAQTTGNSMAVNYDDNDLLNFDTPLSFNRNASAPNLESKNKKDNIDPFEDFLAQNSFPNTTVSSRESLTKPNITSKPNYDSTLFNMTSGSHKKDSESSKKSSVFDDLLSSQGFNVQNKGGSKTLADMRKEEEKKTMDPIQFKIKNWTSGKERNIRALLASLNNILWEGASTYKQPSMGDLLDPSQVKKCYYKACLVVHPDKQTGTPNEDLAKAIFTELNDAWSAFENGPS
uniref:Protein kinase domain-containing protein n=1 Tax=Parastrongyloides trichosuri TaxID=131310 RepID=A0A0N4ZJC5_PARTI